MIPSEYMERCTRQHETLDKFGVIRLPMEEEQWPLLMGVSWKRVFFLFLINC